MSSSMGPDQMMGGIRNGNLQEQQWHLVCNDPLSGLDRCKKTEMQTRIFYKKRSCGLGITIQITEESKRGYDNGKLLHYV